jgi:hypothetical protein
MSEIRPLLRYTAPAFAYERSGSSYLRLQVAANELALAVFDPLPASFVLIEKFPVQKGYAGLQPHQAIARILHDHPAGRTIWKKVEVISMSPVYTLVPASIGNDLEPALHLQLVHKLDKNLRTESRRISALDVVLMYAWPEEMAATLQQYFPSAGFNHYVTYLMHGLLSGSSQDAIVTAHVHGFYLDIIVVKDSKILFFNVFHFQNQDDFIYFLLLVFDRLGLDREKVKLMLSGEIESGSALYSLCFRYFRMIDFLNRDPVFSVPEAGEDADPLPAHAFYSLLHQGFENY